MRQSRIVVVGDAMLDILFGRGRGTRISPRLRCPCRHGARASPHAPRGRRQRRPRTSPPSVVEARLVAVVGDDARGDSLRGELAAHRLRDQYVITAPARPTTSKTRVMARGQQVVRIDEEVDDPISERTESQLTRMLEQAMEDADALLIEDYNKGVLTTGIITGAMASLARRREVPVVVDPKV